MVYSRKETTGKPNMSKNTSIILNGQLENFVQSQIDSGHYGSASDVIRAGLRLLEQQNLKINQLRDELAKGEEGEAIAISDYKAKFAEKREQYLSAKNVN